jgi:hypothetical protein
LPHESKDVAVLQYRAAVWCEWDESQSYYGVTWLEMHKWIHNNPKWRWIEVDSMNHTQQTQATINRIE